MSRSSSVPHQRVSLRFAVLLSAVVDAADALLEVLETVNVVVPDGLLILDCGVRSRDLVDGFGSRDR
ncbi:hypothetical protein ACFRMQ_15485 [Kitasatospora sp. NPDC056783]|uniref:hypothetical protein n=1 Tax=Kitasatospora sp. NPDC056783 TaxID=3345943 RepID=UPI0036AE4F2B